MTASTLFGRSLVLLATFAMGAGVTVATARDRKTSAQQPTTAEGTVTVRQPQDASPPSQTPAIMRAAAPIAPPAVAPAPPPPPPIALPPVPPAPPAVERTEADIGALAQEVQQLRDDLARLKQELTVARVDSQTAVLWDVDRQLAGIRVHLVENQAKHEEESEAAERSAAQRHEAVQMLFAAQGRLATGNAHVLDSLDAAMPALPYPAQTALRNARDRLQSEDLYAARYWIGVAILESGWSQLVQ